MRHQLNGVSVGAILPHQFEVEPCPTCGTPLADGQFEVRRSSIGLVKGPVHMCEARRPYSPVGEMPSHKPMKLPKEGGC